MTKAATKNLCYLFHVVSSPFIIIIELLLIIIQTKRFAASKSSNHPLWNRPKGYRKPTYWRAKTYQIFPFLRFGNPIYSLLMKRDEYKLPPCHTTLRAQNHGCNLFIFIITMRQLWTLPILIQQDRDIHGSEFGRVLSASLVIVANS